MGEKITWKIEQGQAGIKLSAFDISAFRYFSCQSDHFLHFVSGSSPVLCSSLKKYSPSLSAFSLLRVRPVISREADLEKETVRPQAMKREPRLRAQIDQIPS